MFSRISHKMAIADGNKNAVPTDSESSFNENSTKLPKKDWDKQDQMAKHMKRYPPPKKISSIELTAKLNNLRALYTDIPEHTSRFIQNFAPTITEHILVKFKFSRILSGKIPRTEFVGPYG